MRRTKAVLGKLLNAVIEPYNARIKRKMVKDAPFTVELKKVEKSYGVTSVMESIQNLKHGNDGLIFTSAIAPYRIGTCDKMLKWKPPELNTIDFLVSFCFLSDIDRQFKVSVKENGQGEIYELYVIDRKKDYQLFGVMLPTNDAMAEEFRINNIDGRIVECSYDKEQDCWRFLRIREDKDSPNYIEVAKKIMQTIVHGVTLNQVRLDMQKLFYPG